MILTNISYSQKIGEYDEWHLKDVDLGKLNLIVSRNAVGKTRTVNILNALAIMLLGKTTRLLDGKWELTFMRQKKPLRYILDITGQVVNREEFIEQNTVLLKRSGEEGSIMCFEEEGEFLDRYSPPKNKLTNQVRRDVKAHPFIEELVNWAENYHSFTFSTIRPNQMTLLPPQSPGISGIDGVAFFSPDLSLVPYLLKEIENDTNTIRSIIKDLKRTGYEITQLDVVDLGPGGAPYMRVVERGVKFPINQISISQGMYRVIAIIVTINYLMARAKAGTVVIDDLCEGLDFSRSSKLASMLFKKVRNTDIQLIATTNERFLMNSVDLKYWNIFERRGNYVSSFNYRNSKKAFDEFLLTGMNSFDFFANELYKRLKIE